MKINSNPNSEESAQVVTYLASAIDLSHAEKKKFSITNKCRLCNKDSQMTCSQCGNVFYCSMEHKNDDL